MSNRNYNKLSSVIVSIIGNKQSIY